MSARMRAKVKLLKRNSRNAPYEKWVTVGAAFVLPSGQINLVLDTLPVFHSEWDGNTIVLFPPDAEEQE